MPWCLNAGRVRTLSCLFFLYTVAGSIPGLQDFYGLGASISGFGGSEVDITAVSLRGEAKIF